MPPSTKPRPRPKTSVPHKIRIIGGRFKRTPIAVIASEGLRPTPDRVRETLFNWLAHLWDGQFEGKRVLDAFAGSGALGLEAASRGVAAVTMIEHDRRAVGALRLMCEKLGLSEVSVVAGDAITTMGRLGPGNFDLVLLDPPFGQDMLARALGPAEKALAPHGLLYVEAETVMPTPEGMELVRIDRAGAVHFHLFRRATETP